MNIPIDMARYVISVMAVLTPLAKLFFEFPNGRQRALVERYAHIKTYFNEIGPESHPLLAEAAFAVAMGHTRISAKEIPLCLRQEKPSQFLVAYARVHEYVQVTADATAFELRAPASNPFLRWSAIAVGFAVYAALAIAALCLMFYVAPAIAMRGDWSKCLVAYGVALCVGAAGVYALYEVSKLHWAVRLVARQRSAGSCSVCGPCEDRVRTQARSVPSVLAE